MAAAVDRVLSSKPCSLQNPDKSLSEGTAYVYRTMVRFVARGGAAGGGQQRLELEVGDIKGQKRAKGKPMLLVETGTKGRHVFLFQSDQDREAVVAAITSAQAAAAAPAEQGQAGGGAAAGGATAAAAAAAGTPAAASAAAAAAAAGNQGAVQLAQQLSATARRDLLAKHSVLAGQYKALVVDSKALTDEEFWCSPAVQKMAGLSGMPSTTPRASRKGLANRIVDLARQQEKGEDGAVVKLQLTPEDEQQLLAEKPALRQLYDAQVGVQLSRGEFWQRYFRYYMAKRSKCTAAANRFKQLQQNLTADSAAAVADMTGGRQQHETSDIELEALISALDSTSGQDAAARRGAMKRRLDPGVDLAAAAGDSLTGDGYGLAHNAARSEAVRGYTALTQQLAQDYNIHGAAVIGQAPGQQQPAAAAAAAAAQSSRQAGGAGASSSSAAAAAGAGAGGAAAAAAGGDEMSEEELRRYRDTAGSGLEDLQAPLQQQFEELRVTNPRLYFTNIQQQQQQQQPQAPPAKQQRPLQQQQQLPQDVVSLIRGIRPDELSEQPMQPSVAFEVLSELSGGDAAEVARRGGTGALPAQRLDFMQQQAMVVDELLRHFWGLIPVNSAEKEAKLGRIQASLDSCSELLSKAVEQAEPQHKAPLGRLAKPLWEQLDTAQKAAKQIHAALAARKKGGSAAAGAAAAVQ